MAAFAVLLVLIAHAAPMFFTLVVLVLVGVCATAWKPRVNGDTDPSGSRLTIFILTMVALGLVAIFLSPLSWVWAIGYGGASFTILLATGWRVG